MTKVFFKIAGLFLILILINVITRTLFQPHAWGDNVLTAKLKQFEKDHTKYNAVYFGGSLVYRQIDPSIIDSTLKEEGIDLRSYNLGIDAQNFLRIEDNVNHIVKNYGDQLKYVFISLSSSMEIHIPNLHAKETFYWLKPKIVCNAIKILKDYPVRKLRKLIFGYAYGISEIEYLLNFGLGRDIVEYHVEPKDESFYNGKNMDGYYPYTNSLKGEHLFGKNEADERMLLQTRKNFEAHYEQSLVSIKKEINKDYNNRQKKKPIKHQLKMCTRLIENLEHKGIQTVFIIPARARGNYDILLPIFDQLPEKNKVDIGNPKEYPEFYNYEYSFNFFHLNNLGGKIYSLALAQKLSHILEN